MKYVMISIELVLLWNSSVSIWISSKYEILFEEQLLLRLCNIDISYIKTIVKHFVRFENYLSLNTNKLRDNT